MRWRRRIGGSVLAGAAMVSALATAPTLAANLSLQIAPSTKPQGERFLFHGSYDGWYGGAFASGGLLWSPGGLDREGFVAKLMAGSGTYRYRAGSIDTKGYVAIIDAMPGWHFKRGTADITLYGGLDVQKHRLRPDDLNNTARGTHAGLRIGADIWAEPTAATMASANFSFATIGGSYWSRLALGWRIFERVYLGPEVHTLGDETYSQWRIGLHATALKTGSFEWSFGTGYVDDSDNRSGLYGRIGVLSRR
jgi:hypothetical protein